MPFRPSWIACAFVFFFASYSIASDHPLREWKLTDGTSIFARYASTEQTKVILQLADATEYICRFGDVSDLDQKYLTAMRYIDGDRKQFDEGLQILSQLKNGESESVDRLESLVKKQKDAPYASLWWGVALASIENKTKESRAAFDEAIRIIEQQRASDPIRHRRTLMAALNNKAITLVRDREEERAADYFLKAFQISDGAPLSLIHNTRQFLEITSARNFPRKPSESDRKKLQSFVDASAVTSIPNLPVGYHYSIEVDVPSNVTNAYGFEELASPHPLLELQGVTLGVVVGKNTVLTTDYALSKTEGTNIAVTAYAGAEADRQQIPASEILVHPSHPLLLANAASKTYTSTTLTQWSPVRIKQLPLITGTIPTDLLSVVRFEKLEVEPVRYVRSFAKDNEEFVALGFKRGRSFLSEGAIVSKQLLSQPSEQPSFFRSSIPISFSTRGAPVLDPQTGLVKGILAREPAMGSAVESRSEYLTATAIADWLRSAIPDCDFAESTTTEKSVKENLYLAQQATIPLLIWKQKGNSLDPKIVNFYVETERVSATNPIVPLAIRDPWCFYCKGTSVITCRDCEGRGARVVGVENQVHSINPITKQPRILPVQKFAPCSTCRSTGKADCPFCERGKTAGKSL